MSVPRCRPARARAAGLLVQLPARRVPALHGPRPPAGDRPGPPRAGPRALDLRGRARPVDARVELRLLRGSDRGDRRAVGDPDGRPLVGARRRGPRPLPARHGRRADLRQLPQPDGPAALLHARVRGDRLEPAAPLPRDRLAADARADRGVHDPASVPRVQGRTAQARGAGGHDRRPQHPRLHAPVRLACARVPARARADRDREPDRRPDREGDPRAADLPRRRRCRLPRARSGRGDAVGRRGAAPAARDADRLAAGRRPLHPRRAVDRAPSARQREADRHARAAARPRQHRARGRARRGDDARGRASRRHGSRRGRARRPRGRAGHGQGGREGQGLGHRRSSSRAGGRSRSTSAAPRKTARSGCAARPCTTSRTSMWSSRSGSSSA